MPKVYLSEQQRIEARYERIRKCIADRVVVYMHRNHHTRGSLASSLSMGHTTFEKLLSGEDVLMTTTRFIHLLDMAGLKIVPKQKDELEDN